MADDVLEVLDDEIRSIPMMADHIRFGGLECDEAPAVERLQHARDRIAELIAADVEYDEAHAACLRARGMGYSAGCNYGDRLHAATVRRIAALAACRGL